LWIAPKNHPEGLIIIEFVRNLAHKLIIGRSEGENL